MRPPVAVAAALVFATVSLPSLVASANGRAPATNGVRFRPGDTHSIFAATTFGLLTSDDDGCTFRWICEQNIGYGGVFDPKYRIGADGTIFATTFNGLRASYDNGCSFTTVTSPVWFDALDIGPTGEVWAGTAENGTLNDIFASKDNGATFEPRGLESATVWYKSLAVAPSDANRVYTTGYQVAGAMPVAHLFRSDDDGATWLESALSGVAYGTTPIIYALAVDPHASGTVLVSSLGANPPKGDILYRSEDGGATLTQVLATDAEIRDVVYRDSNNVVVATGTGAASTLVAGPSYVSSDGGKTFAMMPGATQLTCAGQRDDGTLFGCAQNWEPDYKAVARGSADGSSFSDVFRFIQLAGPISCPAGTGEHDACGTQWVSLQQQFGSTGPTCGSNIEPPDAAPVEAPVAKPPGGGCCDTGGASGPATLGFGLGVGALVLRRRRR